MEVCSYDKCSTLLVEGKRTLILVGGTCNVFLAFIIAWHRGVSQNCIIKDSDFPSPVKRRTMWRLEAQSDGLRASIGRVPLKQEEQSRQAALPPCSLAVRSHIRRWEPSVLFTIQSSCIGATCDVSFATKNAEDLPRS